MPEEILCHCGEPLDFNLDENWCPNGHVHPHSFAELVANAKRELEKRYQVYPRLVASRKMRDVEANNLIAAQTETVVVLSFLQKYKSEFLEFLEQKGFPNARA